LPLFLSADAERYEAPRSSLRLKASLSLATATAIGLALALLWGDPTGVFAELAALIEIPMFQRGPDQSTVPLQSVADAQASPTTASAAPSHEEMTATAETAGQSQAEGGETQNGALLKQFQAWAAEQDARAQVEPPAVEPVRAVQAAQAQALPAAAPSLARSDQRQRRVRPVRDARAEIRRAQYPPAGSRQAQNARVTVRPGQDGRPQEQSGLPSFLQGLTQRE
jgi:hypothetical protein